MGASYRIIGHRNAGLLEVSLGGLFEIDDVHRLRSAIVEELRSLGCPPGSHRSLYDIRECKIQPQNVVAGLRGMSDQPGRVACRLAIVVGGSLMSMQLRRIVGRERTMRTFDDRPTALGWVLGPA